MFNNTSEDEYGVIPYSPIATENNADSLKAGDTVRYQPNPSTPLLSAAIPPIPHQPLLRLDQLSHEAKSCLRQTAKWFYSLPKGPYSGPVVSAINTFPLFFLVRFGLARYGRMGQTIIWR